MPRPGTRVPQVQETAQQAFGLFFPLAVSNWLCEVVPHLKPLAPQLQKAMPNLGGTAPAVPREEQPLPSPAAGTSTQGQQHPLCPLFLMSFFQMT